MTVQVAGVAAEAAASTDTPAQTTATNNGSAKKDKNVNTPLVLELSVTDPGNLALTYIKLRCKAALGGYSLRFWNREWFRSDGKIFKKISESELRADLIPNVRNALKRICAQKGLRRLPRVTSALINNIVESMTSTLIVPDDQKQPCWLGPADDAKKYIVLENGLVDLDTLMQGGDDLLFPHSANWFSLVLLPYIFEPKATSPKWLQFQDEIFESDAERIALLQEIFGWLIAYDNSRQKFVLFAGEGANGKSVVLAVLTRLLGPDNVSHVPLEMFGDRFQLTQTIGELANIASEIGEVTRVAEGCLKAFTAGDRMYFDRKFKDGLNVEPTARLLFSTNNLPRFSDRSGGMWRRLMLIPFDVVIPEDKQDKQLVSKLCEELPGILLWAIEGRRRLETNGCFTEPKVCKEALEQYRTDSNPARQFLLQQFTANSTGSVRCDGIYAAYVQWAQETEQRPLTPSEFGKEVFRTFPNAEKRRLGPDWDRHYCYTGIS
jgi:putative DNA primase/helicase